MRSGSLAFGAQLHPSVRRAGTLAGGVALLTALVLTGAAAGSRLAAATPSAAMATTFYALPTSKQYINNSGDRDHGVGNNPFGNYAGVSLNIPVNASERLSGPFPGDYGEYAFNLFTNPSHSTSAGTGIFICQYGFDQNSICDVALDLSDGQVVGKGPMNFDDEHWALAVTGGTGAFRGVKGSIIASAGGPATQAQPVRRSVPIIQAQALTITTHPVAGAGAGWQHVVVKESPDNETFVDNNDDEARGDVNNPWGEINNEAANIIDEHVNGPFPGDEAFFTFHIETGSGGKGLGFFMCQYYFSRYGFCHATFQFGNGTLVAEGTFNFNAKTFTLAVTGGYGGFGDEVGEVDAERSNGQVQKLTFVVYRA